ncbi:hypothetical protein [Erythrobacter sp. CCH5-A1]|uniref:hypothetical protein n=1 Tax=Erythrobacter sp. CCH5-A1 TaxID=1768792 RepID=UPI0008298F9A|nr:hypothetical protein [Erythrobacter sp. CCH5-A1]
MWEAMRSWGRSVLSVLGSAVQSGIRYAVDTGKKIVSVGKRVVNAALSAAKEALIKTAIVIADHGHSFVDSVKRTWTAVKPYLQAVGQPILAFLKSATSAHPRLNAFVHAVDKLLDLALKFFVTPIAAALEKAVRWTIDMITKVVDRFIRKDEWGGARRKRDLLREKAAEMMAANPDEAHTLLLLAMFIDFELARAGVAQALEQTDMDNFDQYLRLQAAQSLLELAELRLRNTEDFGRLTEADFLIVEMGSAMLGHGGQLDEEKLAMLNDIIEAEYGSRLFPFVFEKLLIAWAARSVELDRLYKAEAGKVSALLHRRAILSSKLRPSMSQEEKDAISVQIANVEAEVEMAQELADEALERAETMSRYQHAGEGVLLQVQKSDDALAADLDDIETKTALEIAPLLIGFIEKGVAWSDIRPREIADKIDRFALLYQEAYKQRMMRLEFGSGHDDETDEAEGDAQSETDSAAPEIKDDNEDPIGGANGVESDHDKPDDLSNSAGEE